MNLQSIFAWKSAKLTTRTISGLAMLCALYVVLSLFAIPLSPTLEIRFSFIALAISCALYGFWPNMIFCFTADFLGYCVRPSGAYVPFFALILMAKALFYTLFFYDQKKITIPRILIAEGLVMGVGNLLLNPLLLTVMYQTPYWVLVASRLVKNILLYPVNCAVLYVAFRLLPGRALRPIVSRMSSSRRN